MADRRPTFPDRLYRRLLSLFPSEFRGDFGTEVQENLVHGSDSAESAEREIKIFFPEL